MKCPECKAKIPKKAEFCPECSHQLTDEEKSAGKGKKKILWFILGPVLAIILVLAIIVFYATFVTSTVELISLEVPSENIDYDDSIPIEISVECFGMAKQNFEVPVYLDGDLIYTFDIDFEGTSMGDIEVIDMSVDISDDATTIKGEHTVAAGELTDDFNVYSAPSFTFTCDADQYYYITGYTFTVDCAVENTGETAGECECVSSFDGVSVDERTLDLAGNSSEAFSVDVAAAEGGVHEFALGDETYDMMFYEPTRPETGKLMENTIKGYGYMDFENLTDTDIIVYITSVEDEYTAVAARYIRAGESHKIDSIVHGEYYIIIQTGTDYVAAQKEFYTDQGIYYIGSIDIDTNVVNGSGFYTYYDIELTPSLLDEWKTEIDFIPSVVDNM